MSDTPRKQVQTKNISAPVRLVPDRFDQQASDLVQQLAMDGESFNDIRAVTSVVAAALRAAAKPPSGFVIAPDEPTTEMFGAAWAVAQELCTESGGAVGREQVIHVTDRYYRAMIDARPR